MHKIILLFWGLCLSSIVFAQDWKNNYESLKETSDGRYIAERLGLFGLLSAEGEVLLPFEKDSLVEKPMVYLRYASDSLVNNVYRKELTEVEGCFNCFFPKQTDSVWLTKKGIPVYKKYFFVSNKNMDGFYFEAEKFDFIKPFKGSSRFLMASKSISAEEEQCFLLDIEKEKRFPLENCRYHAALPQIFMKMTVCTIILFILEKNFGVLIVKYEGLMNWGLDFLRFLMKVVHK